MPFSISNRLRQKGFRCGICDTVSPSRYQLILFSTFVLFTLTVSLVIFYFYVKHSQQILFNDIKSKATLKFEFQQERVNDHIGHIQDYMEIIINDVCFQGFIAKDEDRQDVEQFVMNIAAAEHIVSQIRFLDADGNERFRVDKALPGKAVLATELQNKKHRYYFQDAMKLDEGEYFVSDLDLNMEYGRIEVPHKPTLRIATPIFYNGEKKGLLVINMDASHLFTPKYFEDLFELYIIDHEGYYLLHPDPSKSWSKDLGTGHMFGPRNGKADQLEELLKQPNQYEFEVTGTLHPMYLVAEVKASILEDQREQIRSSVLKVFFIVLFFSLVTASILSTLLSRVYREMQEKNSDLESAMDILDKHIIYSETDLSGKITAASTAFANISGYSKEELIGKPHSIVRHPENPSDMYAMMWKKIKSGKVWQREIKNFSKSGETYYVLATIKPKYDADGHHVGYISVRVDTTANKELQSYRDQLVFQSRHAIMGEMIGIIAHQWKQPLNHISSEVYSLYKLAQQSDKKNAATHYGNAENILVHLADLISTFQQFFKPQHNVKKLSIENVVHVSLTLMEATLKKHDVTLTFSNTASCDTIEAIENEISQVVVNILQNALDEFERKNIEKPWLNVAIQNDKDMVMLRICDNAGGVNEQSLSKMFNPYYTTKGSEGTGLGLYLASMVVEEKLNGKISAENSKDGLCVIVTVPVCR